MLHPLSPIFWAPAIIGLYLLVTVQGSASFRFKKMAGLLTLKPILTTQLWLLAATAPYGSVDFRPQLASQLLGIVPGAALTLLIVIVFRSLFFGPEAGAAGFLIALDCVRWINTLLFSLIGIGMLPGQLFAPTFLLGLSMPTLFACVRWA